MTQASSQGNEDLKNIYTGFEEEREVMGKRTRTMVYEPRRVNWGSFSKVYSFRFLLASPIFGDKDLLFSGYRKGTCPVRVYALLQGRSKNPSCSCHCSSSSHLHYSICQGAIFGGSTFQTLSQHCHLYHKNNTRTSVGLILGSVPLVCLSTSMPLPHVSIPVSL